MTVLIVILTLLITFAITWLLAKLHILDLIASIFGGYGFIRLLIIVCIFIVTFIVLLDIVGEKVHKAKADFDYKHDFSSVYLTTTTELDGYKKIMKRPYGKELCTLPAGTVIKVEKVKRKKAMTWLESYDIVRSEADENGGADMESRHLYVLIPWIVSDVKQDSYYFSSSNTSDVFSNYYDYIDAVNAQTKENVRVSFLKAIQEKGVAISSSTDVVFLESSKKTHFFLPKEGYFDEFAAEGNSFYYVSNKQKRLLKKIVKTHQKMLDNELRTYFKK
ncbi:MAG: hypothetical protein IJP61_12185 [Treponema sp.]|nr:hypothetical protein [Treponema sp.]